MYRITNMLQLNKDHKKMESWPDEQRLLANLLHQYEPAARPVYNASSVVTVKFGLTLIQIFDMVSQGRRQT